MTKTLKLENLGCANCAAKMETKVQKLDGVTSASINFMTQKLVLEADDSRFDEIVQEAAKVMRKVEPDVRVVL